MVLGENLDVLKDDKQHMTPTMYNIYMHMAMIKVKHLSSTPRSKVSLYIYLFIYVTIKKYDGLSKLERSKQTSKQNIDSLIK